MTGYKLKAFDKILKKNGYILGRQKSDHRIYTKSGHNPITIPYRSGSKELPRPMIKRLIKENNIMI